MHFHAYKLIRASDRLHLQLDQRWSTDAAGIARCLGLQTSTKVELAEILTQVDAKLSGETLLTVADAPPPTRKLAAEATDPG